MFATRILATILPTIILAGCAHHQVIVPISNPTGDKVRQPSTVSSLKGGMYRLVAECDTDILNEVSIHQNISQSFINIFTLGIISPIEIEYQCGKPKISKLGSLDDE